MSTTQSQKCSQNPAWQAGQGIAANPFAAMLQGNVRCAPASRVAVHNTGTYCRCAAPLSRRDGAATTAASTLRATSTTFLQRRLCRQPATQFCCRRRCRRSSPLIPKTPGRANLQLVSVPLLKCSPHGRCDGAAGGTQQAGATAVGRGWRRRRRPQPRPHPPRVLRHDQVQHIRQRQQLPACACVEVTACGKQLARRSAPNPCLLRAVSVGFALCAAMSTPAAQLNCGLAAICRCGAQLVRCAWSVCRCIQMHR
jgi:hypothetical protein